MLFDGNKFKKLVKRKCYNSIKFNNFLSDLYKLIYTVVTGKYSKKR